MSKYQVQQDISSRLSGSLGIAPIVFMVVAAAGPITVIIGIMPLGVAAGNGPAFPIIFALSTVILLIFAVGFCAMSRHVTEAGAFYTYIREGLGRRQGLAGAYLAIVTYTAVQLAISAFIGVNTAALVTRYGGPTLPWWLFSLAAIAVATALGYRHIELSGKVLATLLVCELLIIVAFDAVVTGTHGMHGQAFSTAMFTPSAIVAGSIGVALMFTITSFLGFEATAVFRDEAKDPHESIPRATYIAIALIGTFYTVSGWALMTQWGDNKAVDVASAHLGTSALDAIGAVLGPIGFDLAEVLLITSLFAALLSFHNVLARYFFNLSRHRAAPRFCGRTHPQHGSPYIATLVQSVTAAGLVVVCALAGLDPVTEVWAWMAGTSTVGILALLTLTSASILVYFMKTAADTRWWHARVAPALAFLGLGYCLLLTVINFSTLTGGSTAAACLIGGIVIAAYLIGLVFTPPTRRATGTTALRDPNDPPAAQAPVPQAIN